MVFAMDTNSPVYSSLQELLVSKQVFKDKSVKIIKLILKMEHTPSFAMPGIFVINRPRGFGLSIVGHAIEKLVSRAITDDQINKLDDIALLDGVPRRKTYNIDFKHFKAKNINEFTQNLLEMLQDIFWKNHIESQFSQYETPKSYFTRLIKGLKKIGMDMAGSEDFQEMCFIIDNYDVPLQVASNFSDPLMVNEATSIYLDMLNALKYARDSIKWVLMTGHIKFSLATEFSEGLPLAYDLSSDPDLSTLFGFSKEEVGNIFKTEIEKYCENYGLTANEYLDILDKCYGGFSFSDSLNKMICPASIYHVMNNNGQIFPYSAAGKYSFLQKVLSNSKESLDWLYNKDGQDPVFSGFIDTNGVKGKSIGTLLVQLGFATRQKVLLNTAESFTTWRYRFNFPNLEMKKTLNVIIGKEKPDVVTEEIDFSEIFEGEDE